MLTPFIKWARFLAASKRMEGAEIQVTESVFSDNPSARLDIDTPAAVARITCWESGDYDAEIISLDTECILYSTHGVLKDDRTVEEQFLPFLEVIDTAGCD